MSVMNEEEFSTIDFSFLEIDEESTNIPLGHIIPSDMEISTSLPNTSVEHQDGKEKRRTTLDPLRPM